MINPVRTAAKCCGCIVLSQLIGILVSLALLAAFVLAFYFYAIPWGEDQIRAALRLPAGTDIGSLDASVVAANNCSGCVFGVNTDWPTNTTGALHFLDTSAGPTASAVIATSLVAGAAAGAGSMLWASIVPSATSLLSFSSGFYEMTHIIEQAQFIGMISQLQIDGAPVFLHQFSREMAWTNFNVPKSITDTVASTRRRLDTSLLATTASGETGPTRYAVLIGVKPKHLFFYTLLSFALVVGAIHVLYFLGVLVLSMLSKKKSFGQVAGELYRKVIWACILALLLAQYIFSMAGSYYIYENGSGDNRDGYFIWGAIGLVVMVGFAIVFGVMIIGSNRDELKDIGTYAHDQRPFAAKYSAYYDEYNFDNRFFFVPRILLAVSTGAVVGTIQDSTTQLLCILGITVLYLILLLWREPNLLRFLYYIGITSVFMKVVLVCMMLMLVQDNFFPQNVRDNVAYGIIGVNMFIFFLLFLRQAYTIIHKIVRGCKNKDRSRASSGDEVINLEHGNDAPRNPPYSRIESADAHSNPNYNHNKNGDQRGLHNQGAMAGQQHQQGYANQQGNQFARNDFGGPQRNPYDQPSSDVGMANGGRMGNGKTSSNDWDRYDSRTQQQQQQYQNAAAGGVAAGAALGTAATRDRNNNGHTDYYQSMASPAHDQASLGYNAKAGIRGNRYSNASAGSAPFQASAKTNANQFGKPLRKASFDLDEIDDDDVVAEPPAIKQVNSAPTSQQSTGNDRINPAHARTSYLRFTDSDMSSIEDDIDGRSPRSVNTHANGGGAPPGSSTSVGSTFSTNSNATDPFDRRSKTEIEDEDTSLIIGTVAATAGVSTFGQRESLDSYTTDLSNDLGANHSFMTGASDTSAGDMSSNFDTMRSLDTSGLIFEDDNDDETYSERSDAIRQSISDESDRIEESEAREGDIDIDDLEPLSSPRVSSHSSIDSYETEGEQSFHSFKTVNSKASSSASDFDKSASAYLRGVDEGDNDMGEDADEEFLGGHGSNNHIGSDSLYAMSTRSDDDASFYIDGQRRNAGSPIGESDGAESARIARQTRMKKL